MGSCGMKTHVKQSIELDHLNLAPEAKVEVSNLIQTLLDETKKQADEFLKQNIIFSMLDNARFGKHSIALLTKLE